MGRSTVAKGGGSGAGGSPASDPDVEAAIEALLPALRAALAQVKASQRSGSGASVLREAPGDRELADDLTRQRARMILERHAKKAPR